MKQKMLVVLYFASVVLPLLDIFKGIKRGISKARIDSTLARQKEMFFRSNYGR
jgi:hypothetical protein